MKRLNILLLLIPLLLSNTLAQPEVHPHNIINLTDSLLSKNPSISIHSKIILFRPGDNIHWADPQYPDSDWNGYNSSETDSVGWFRFYFVSGPNLKNNLVGVSGYATGEIELYYDNILVCKTLSRYPISLPQVLPGKHLIAIRYYFPIDNRQSGSDSYNFFIQFSSFKKSNAFLFQQTKEQMIFVTLPLAFALLHLVLFIFLPTARGNLYYAVFLVLFAISTFADIHASYLSVYAQSNFYLLVHRFFNPLTQIVFLLFLYEIFYDKIPKQFWFFVAAYEIVQILILIKPQGNYHYFVILGFIQTLEIIRIISVALFKKKDGALIFAIAVAFLFIFGSYDAMLDLEIMTPVNGVTNAYYFGMIGLFVATTVFLSRDFARTNKKIIEKETDRQRLELEKQLLQIEDNRKTNELEAARSLQLSMLPQCLNDFPNLDVCFSLVPASEVGGDYYDFFRDKNDTLTIVVGDATGHGMQAGMMVSIIKSLFVADIKDCGLVDFLNKATNTIKQMKLGNIFMALQLLRVQNNHVKFSSAGMPPIFIYRKNSDEIEEITLKAMPLGGPVSIPYQEIKTEINNGDVILMLTDGLPELFNAQKELLDYSPVLSTFKNSVHKTADEIVSELFKLGDVWRQEYPQEDDITLVVIKVK